MAAKPSHRWLAFGCTKCCDDGTCRTQTRLGGRYASGFVHRTPAKRAKSASTVATSSPCSIAKAPSKASGMRFAVAPESRWPNHVPLDDVGLPQRSWAMTEQVRTIARTRIVDRVGRVDASTLQELRRWVRDFLDL